MATLIHDDIIDGSLSHRGAVTIQSQYSRDIAVYTSDLLFTGFFTLIAGAIDGSEFMKVNTQGVKRSLLDEFGQMSYRFNRRTPIPAYLRSVNGKAAELFSLGCLEGAYFSYSSEEVQRLVKRTGCHIGIVFQVYDDILDYAVDTETLKKSALEDLSQGVYTLPLLFAYRTAPNIFNPCLDKGRVITLEEAAEVAVLVNDYHGITEAQAFTKKVTNEAITDIRQLPDGTAKKTLLSLTEFLLHRSF